MRTHNFQIKTPHVSQSAYSLRASDPSPASRVRKQLFERTAASKDPQTVIDAARGEMERTVPKFYRYGDGKWTGKPIDLPIPGLRTIAFTPVIFLQNYRGAAVHLRVELLADRDTGKISYPIPPALLQVLGTIDLPRFAPFNLDLSTAGTFFTARLVTRNVETVESILQRTVAAIEAKRNQR